MRFDYRDPVEFVAVYEQCGRDLRTMEKSTGVPRRTLNDYKLKFVSDSQSADGDDPLPQFLEYFYSRTLPNPRSLLASIKESGEIATAVVLCDLHFPYHHRPAIEVARALIKRWQPHLVILNGDTLDMEELSTFPKNPNPASSLQERLDQARQLLADLKASAPEAAWLFVPGNHEENRIRRLLWTTAQPLASLRCLGIESLLGLAELGIAYEPEGVKLTPEFIVSHGDRFTNALGGGSAQSARKEVLDYGTSTCSGHTHKGGLYLRRDARGYRCGLEGYCLCDADSMQRAGLTRSLSPGKKLDWHLGFWRIDYHTKGEAFGALPVTIVDTGKRTFAIVCGEEVSVDNAAA